ncbi:MAG: hypothetical protein QOJ94_1585 [Sphingomonadales bacterium]|jgi:hypothetical protein|nr:hypothetical protein [Sphingomonadales bacterium]
MPLPVPAIDTRTYQRLVDETLARVPIHTPEWTNFNASDPGVTLVQLFAFLAEAMIYRANQIPARNRAKFLDLLDIPLRPASEAMGLATITNERGPIEATTIAADTELLAGKVPFRTQLGLDVLPIETRIVIKRPVDDPPPELLAYYNLLYASYQADFPVSPKLYESIQLDPTKDAIDLAATTDRSLWIALIARPDDRAAGEDPWQKVREALGGRTLSLGLAPDLAIEQRVLLPGGGRQQPSDLLAFELPQVGADGLIGFDADGAPAPSYRRLEARLDFDPLTEAGVVQIPLPDSASLRNWSNLDPLEAGVGELPPAIDDTAVGERIITWLRVRATGGARVELRWAGINATPIRQIERVLAEPLAPGDGTPDQIRRLAKAPVLEGSIALTSIDDLGEERRWQEIDDLLAAGPELAIPDTVDRRPTDVFLADHEAGLLRFGDGLAGRRPSDGARLLATYLYTEGVEGNVGPGAIKGGPLLPAGFSATNPIRTWNGADSETVEDGEKQIRRYLQNRDRAVTIGDCETIAWRAPGISIGRIEILPAWHPSLSPAAPGAAPGVITVLAIPRFDPAHPNAPRADRGFLDALCRHLDPRRLVTTELVVRGPIYKGIWISVGIETIGGASIAETSEAVRQRIRDALTPLSAAGFADQQGPLYGPPPTPEQRGWPLRTPVQARVLLAEAARVRGVRSVTSVLLAEGSGPAVETVAIEGIELPEILGISVVAGDPVELSSLRGESTPGPTGPTGPKRLPVPMVAETC